MKRANHGFKGHRVKVAPSTVGPPRKGTRSLLDRARLERRLAILHVDAELHSLGAVALDQRLLVLLQRLLELLVSEAGDVLAALFFGTNELLVNRLPLVALVPFSPSSTRRRPSAARRRGRQRRLGSGAVAVARGRGCGSERRAGRRRQRLGGGGQRIAGSRRQNLLAAGTGRRGRHLLLAWEAESAHLRLGGNVAEHLLQVSSAARHPTLGREVLDTVVQIGGNLSIDSPELAGLQLIELALGE